jgi:hypothetical protein
MARQTCLNARGEAQPPDVPYAARPDYGDLARKYPGVGAALGLESGNVLLVRRQWHLGGGSDANAADPRELHWNGHVFRARVSDDCKM